MGNCVKNNSSQDSPEYFARPSTNAANQVFALFTGAESPRNPRVRSSTPSLYVAPGCTPTEHVLLGWMGLVTCTNWTHYCESPFFISCDLQVELMQLCLESPFIGKLSLIRRDQ